MQTEYRIILTATFDKPENRDAVLARLKEVVAAEKAGFPEGTGWKKAHVTADEYQIPEPARTEAL